MPTITAQNGLLPAWRLATVDTGSNGPQQLATTVAPIWAAMLAAGMPAGCLTSGYRTRSQQLQEVQRAAAGLTPLAAPVGTSMHGEGLAADIAEPARSWARAHAAAWGLRFPLAVEPWHCELDTARIPAPTLTAPQPATPPEETMLLMVSNIATSMTAVIFGDGSWAQIETNTAATSLLNAGVKAAQVDDVSFSRICPADRRRG